MSLHLSYSSSGEKLLKCHDNSTWVIMSLTILLSESIIETKSVVLTFESFDKILGYDHSIQTSSAVLLHGTICFSIIILLKELWDFSLFSMFGTLGT